MLKMFPFYTIFLASVGKADPVQSILQYEPENLLLKKEFKLLDSFVHKRLSITYGDCTVSSDCIDYPYYICKDSKCYHKNVFPS